MEKQENELSADGSAESAFESTEPSQVDGPISCLPPELLVHIFSMVSAKDKGVCSLVCRSWEVRCALKEAWNRTTVTLCRRQWQDAAVRESLVQKGIRRLHVSICNGSEINDCLGCIENILPNLVYLRISNRVGDGRLCINLNPDYLAKMSQLTELLLLSPFNVTITNMVAITRNLSNLIRFEFAGSLDEFSLRLIVGNLSKLKQLTLLGCNYWLDTGIASLIDKGRNVPKLELLHISNLFSSSFRAYISLLDARFLRGLSTVQTDLKYLALSIDLCNFGLEHLCGLANLQELILSGASSFTDDGMGQLVRLKNLRRLQLVGNPDVSDRGLLPLTQLTNLCELRLSFFSGVSEKGWLQLYPEKDGLGMFKYIFHKKFQPSFVKIIP